MGDWFETVVDPEVSLDEAQALADRVTEDFIAKRLVRAELTDCTFGAAGHAPDTGVFSYVQETDEHLLSLGTNGFSVVVGRRVHVPPSVEQVICPECRAASRELGRLGWSDAVGEWYEGREGLLVCCACRAPSSVALWGHEPACGFGNLAFTFWNWPPFEPEYWTESPFEMIRTLTGHRCVLVSGKL